MALGFCFCLTASPAGDDLIAGDHFFVGSPGDPLLGEYDARTSPTSVKAEVAETCNQLKQYAANAAKLAGRKSIDCDVKAETRGELVREISRVLLETFAENDGPQQLTSPVGGKRSSPFPRRASFQD